MKNNAKTQPVRPRAMIFLGIISDITLTRIYKIVRNYKIKLGLKHNCAVALSVEDFVNHYKLFFRRMESLYGPSWLTLTVKNPNSKMEATNL